MSIQAQAYPVYQPAMRIVTNITNDFPALVTTSFSHQYATGLIVRIIVPLGYGMQEINQQFGSITVTSDTTFAIDIDTRLYSPFVVDGSPTQYAQSIPIGEINSTVYLATKNVLPYGAV